MSQLKHYGEHSPAVIDADFRVIDPPEVRARAVRSRAIFRMVCVAPILSPSILAVRYGIMRLKLGENQLEAETVQEHCTSTA